MEAHAFYNCAFTIRTFQICRASAQIIGITEKYHHAPKHHSKPLWLKLLQIFVNRNSDEIFYSSEIFFIVYKAFNYQIIVQLTWSIKISCVNCNIKLLFFIFFFFLKKSIVNLQPKQKNLNEKLYEFEIFYKNIYIC